MKKYVISVLALVIALTGSAFTSGVFKSSDTADPNGYKWWNFNGDSQFYQADPSYYSLDEDDFPDCPVVSGLTYCEVKAKPSPWNGDEPDLSTVSSTRMKQ
jgi:hypothetical protein